METEILENLKKAVIEYDAEGAEDWARKAVKEGVSPVKALDALTEGIGQVGDGYGRGELWLPDLVGAAAAMKSAAFILEEEIKKTGEEREALGVVVIGTVYGDLHDIGKTMVSTLLQAEGFMVHDLGINVQAGQFVEAAKKNNADIVAMSALMTTTLPDIRKVLDVLGEEGLRDRMKIMIGGAPITQDFADSIGADGYDPTAPGAVKVARRLMGE